VPPGSCRSTARCTASSSDGRRWDREIARLAIPAFGALVAEPVYVLTDTAIVGHLGTPQLGGLAVAASVLLTVHALCTFLAYGTTAAVARLLGAGREEDAAGQAVQGLWLAATIGVALAGIGWVVARPLVEALADDPAVAREALVYLRLSLPGLPALLLVLAGTGYLRGLQDTRTPLVVAVVSAAANLVLEVVVVYGLDKGIGASALATVAAQWGAALVYLRTIGRSASALGVAVRPHPAEIRRLLVVGGALVVRTGALRATLLLATAIAARIGTVELGAHQVAYEIWTALALALDAVAIAGQALVGRLLGAGDAGAARAAGHRMLQIGAVTGVVAGAAVLALRPWLPDLFTDDRAVAAACGFVLLHVAVLQPLNAIVFVLDGLLIGAGDLRFLARAMVGATAVFVVAAGVVGRGELGLGWLWAAIGLFMLVRGVPLWRRWRSGDWAVLGVPVR
jgi:putative MATE family efflux protein